MGDSGEKRKRDEENRAHEEEWFNTRLEKQLREHASPGVIFTVVKIKPEHGVDTSDGKKYTHFVRCQRYGVTSIMLLEMIFYLERENREHFLMVLFDIDLPNVYDFIGNRKDVREDVIDKLRYVIQYELDIVFRSKVSENYIHKRIGNVIRALSEHGITVQEPRSSKASSRQTPSSSSLLPAAGR